MEASMKEDNCFLTLTYNASSMPLLISPEHGELGNLNPPDLRDWLKRLRARIAPLRIKFYASGEYGDENFRPHYHAFLFGFPTCRRQRTRQHLRTGEPLWRGCCAQCELVGDTWGFGNVDLGTVEIGSAQYVAGYVNKKMTHRDDSRLLGRHPEFSRMSNRGGIGKDFMWEVASEFLKYESSFNLLSADVPSALMVNGKAQPLGRYLRQELRKMVGRDAKAPKEALQEYKNSPEMLDLRKDQFSRSGRTSFASVILERYHQKIETMKARAKIQKQRRRL